MRMNESGAEFDCFSRDAKTAATMAGRRWRTGTVVAYTEATTLTMQVHTAHNLLRDEVVVT